MLDAKKNKGELQPYLGNVNVRWGAFDLTDLAEMRFEAHEEARYSLKPGDLVVCEGGEPGRCAIWTDVVPRMIQKALHRIRAKSSLDNYYLFYWFRHAANVGLLEPHFTGTTIKHLTGKAIAALQIPLPPVATQRSMVEVLRQLDDRIDLLRQTNTTLESIAQALFKSWFIDFDPVKAKAEGREPEGMDVETAALFPSEFEESELGRIPMGWSVKRIEEVAERIGMGPFGSNIKVSTFVDAGIPVLSGACLKGVLLEDDAFRYISPEHAARLSGALVSEGDIVITHRGTLGQVSLVPKGSAYPTYVLSQSQFFVRAKADATTPEYLNYFLRSPRGQHLLLANASQVGVPSISRPVSYLRSIRLVVPPGSISSTFSAALVAIHNRVMATRRHSHLLVQVRDALLPRLISGKLRLAEAQDEIAAI
ncbi:restriction endonuclease subunit S [Variovorax dokdonensis]|uniref:Restriction endonuclease subunit S n=1 Tax=Variovorax dokdonensis TaxID=344883 RepID=A0ABT7NCQ1_9BURK|nr:restriction endonuclease subunit S [Variovorax dokdonensis]MDM0045717.1 restriction endonuclease subunit S [Variovorax dokdonensis]